MADKGLEQLSELMDTIKGRFKDADGATVRVGWIGNTLGGNMRLAKIARILNYGHEAGVSSGGHKYPALPERNFMRLYEKQHLGHTFQKINHELKRVLKGESSMDTVYKTTGTQGVAGLTKAIDDPYWQSNVPNAPSTVAAWARRHMGQIKRNYRKRGEQMPINLGTLSKQPLRNTGHLIQSIHWDVKRSK